MTRKELKRIAIGYAKAPGVTVLAPGESAVGYLLRYSSLLSTSTTPASMALGEMLCAVADIITNGLEPEPQDGPWAMQYQRPSAADPLGRYCAPRPPNIQDADPMAIKRAIEHLVGVTEKQRAEKKDDAHPFDMRCHGHEPNGDRSYMSGKQSGRPTDAFVGSHNLPWDNDVD